MEEPDDQLADNELDYLLAQWPAPSISPAQRPRPWHARLWTASIRIPVPAAIALLLALGLLALEMRRPAIQPESLGFRELHPVAELKPRVIKNGDN